MSIRGVHCVMVVTIIPWCSKGWQIKTHHRQVIFSRLDSNNQLIPFTWGRFHKSWAQGANHRDSSFKVRARRKARPTPQKSFSKVGRRARIGRKKFMKSTPGHLHPTEFLSGALNLSDKKNAPNV